MPNELAKQLPQITQTAILQSKLKWSSDDEIGVFIARILSFLNPKFNSEDELQFAETELFAFAKSCELTAGEMLLALELCADGNLFSEPDENGKIQKIKLFREIDRLKLGEVKSAFIYHKKIDKQNEIGMQKLNDFLEPQKQEPSQEERRLNFLELMKKEYNRYKKEGYVLASPIFYDLMKKNGLEVVRLKFLERVLDNYKPEVYKSRNAIIGNLDLPERSKVDAKLFFIEKIVNAFFVKEKMAEMSEDEFIGFWVKIYDEK